MNLKELKPSELVMLLNSSQRGEVIDIHALSKLRASAGFLIGDGKTVSLFRLMAWLFDAVEKNHIGKTTDNYFPDIQSIALAYRVQPCTISKHRHSNMYPVRTPKGYPADAVEAFMVACGLAKDRSTILDKDQELAAAARARRLNLEYELAVKKSLTISREEYTRHMRALTEIYVHGTEVMVRQIAVKLRNPKATKIAEEVRDDTRRQMAASVLRLSEEPDDAAEKETGDNEN